MTQYKKQIQTLANFLMENFPEDFNKMPPEGESAVDFAIRLLIINCELHTCSACGKMFRSQGPLDDTDKPMCTPCWKGFVISQHKRYS